MSTPSITPEIIQQIESELMPWGATIEWASPNGIGISFNTDASDSTVVAISLSLRHAAWINLDRTGVTDRSVEHLSSSTTLESLRIADTAISYQGARNLSLSSPSLREIVIAKGQYEREELQALRCIRPGLEIVEM